MWIENKQGQSYWMADPIPEPTSQYNNAQSLKTYADVSLTVKPHPGWRYDNGAFVDDEYLLFNNKFKLIIDAPPILEDSTKVIEKNDTTDWIISESTVEITYTIRDKTSEELQEEINLEWSRIRELRNQKLMALDGAVFIAIENNLSLTTEFKEHRQSLRDLPENYTDPFSVVFPNDLDPNQYFE